MFLDLACSSNTLIVMMVSLLFHIIHMRSWNLCLGIMCVCFTHIQISHYELLQEKFSGELLKDQEESFQACLKMEKCWHSFFSECG